MGLLCYSFDLNGFMFKSLNVTYLPGCDCECVIHLPFRCGLVALWMSAHLQQPQLSIEMETVVRTALSRGYTAQGEMFSGNKV